MTEIITVNPVNPEPDKIKRAAGVIRGGGTVAFPTETVYGLGANAFDQSACERIFTIKQRPADNPLIVHICSTRQLNDVAVGASDEVLKAAGIFWPGPVTLVLNKNRRICAAATGGLDTVAVRMPAHPIALRLIEESGVPIAAPSANLSTRPSTTRPAHVVEDLEGRVDVIIDGGDTAFGMESTIIDATGEPYTLLRPGAFTVEELGRFFGKILVPKGVNRQLVDSETALAPGMKYRHYAPRKRLVAIEGDGLLLEGVERLAADKRVAVLCSTETAKQIRQKVDVIGMGSRGNLYEIAKNLFDSFRKLDRGKAEVGVIETFPERGMGLALMNRIAKASSAYVRTREELARVT